ncbi:hypothetical protein B7486_08940 [cyanobacterium TDX16]|nr:hypothetical protein B7486_08940 [cyanobacterium TDX16]
MEVTYSDTGLAGNVPTLVAGMGWGASGFWRFLVKNGKVKHDRYKPEDARKNSGKFVCKSLKNAPER